MNKELILTFIKKNMLILVCGFVAILALVSVFYPLGGMITQLQSDSDSAAGAYGELNTLLTKPHKLPISDPNQADPGTLNGFPNAPTIAMGKEAAAAWSNQSASMLKAVLDENKANHELLVDDAFPMPKFDSTYFAFAKLYKLVLSTDPAISGQGNPALTPPVAPDPQLAAAHLLNIQNDILNGGLPPTLEEIKAASADLWTNVYQPQVITKNGQPVNQVDLQNQFNDDVAKLPLKMKGDAAKKHKIYVENTAFTTTPTILQVDKPQLTDMWYAQMQVWVQKDLALGIKEENAGATSILDAPIKRLLSMQVPTAPMYIFPPPAPGGASPGGVPATAKETDPLPPIYTVSPTGRYSNGMYDVVPFRLVVDVDASKVNQFIETLANHRLITVTNQNLFALDLEAESAKGYLYGPSSTVRLQLEGEVLYMRSWTQPLMPDRVKMALGLMAPPAGMTPASMSPGGPPPGGQMNFPPGMGPPGTGMYRP
jgi:hypothetical protein